jgi:diguanylate cyclase (GGDEF)-like protein
MNLVLTLMFTAAYLWRGGIWNALSLAHLCLLLPCALALVWLSWSRHYERWYLPCARFLVAAFGALIAVFVALALLEGRDEQLASLTMILFGTYFFAGLMLRQAFLAAVCILTAFAYTAYAAALPFAMFFKSMTIMTLASAIAAIVYRDVELIAELVIRDGLSGLMNRRAFDQHLLYVWHQAIREQRSVALLMIDIDHFKGYNDEWGHQVGDSALRSVAHVIQGFARRPLDLAARYGGDEFVVILYDLAFSHAQYLAERLRESVQNLAHEAEILTGPEVTVSVGVGFAVPSTCRSTDAVVRLADEALYEAKSAGRNRVIAKGAEGHIFMDTGTFNEADRSKTAERTA